MIEVFTKLLWAALGAAAGYYVAKTQLHDYYVEKLRKETEDAQYFFKEKYEAKVKKARLEGAVQATVDMAEEALKLNEETEADYDGEDVYLGPIEGAREAAEALTNYQGISSAPSVLAQEMIRAQMGESVEEAEKIVEEAEEAEKIDAETKPDVPGPRLINFTMYDANENNYDQATVTYFEKGGVVADENDEKMSKEVVDKHIGSYNLEQLGEHRPTIYVRNDRVRMDFEIVWDRDSYDVSVLGKKG